MKKTVISVCVISYNSSSTIIETLQSIANQSYPHLELIISDDCSTDNTVQLCQTWIEENKQRFVHALFLTNDVNTGITANANRAYRAAQGEWIKAIAADDILLPTCIADNVTYINHYPDARLVVSRMKMLQTVDEHTEIVDEYFPSRYTTFYHSEVDNQYRLLLRENYISSPTAFFYRTTLEELNFNDESYPYLDDYPFWLKATLMGYKISFLDQTTVLYRVGESITRSSKHYFNPDYYHSVTKFTKEKILPNFTIRDFKYRYITCLTLLFRHIVFFYLGNKRNKRAMIAEKIYQLLNPQWYANLIE